jgi:predicted DNA-binding transcriptional regulator AlpA
MENQLLVTLNVNELKSIINESIENALTKTNLPIEAESILRRKDVAKLFSVSLVTISDWMKTGRLPYHRINSRIFFRKSEVMQCIEIKEKYKAKKHGK